MQHHQPTKIDQLTTWFFFLLFSPGWWLRCWDLQWFAQQLRTVQRRRGAVTAQDWHVVLRLQLNQPAGSKDKTGFGYSTASCPSSDPKTAWSAKFELTQWSVCALASLIPRLPCSGTQTLKLCRRGDIPRNRYSHSGRAWERGYVCPPCLFVTASGDISYAFLFLI